MAMTGNNEDTIKENPASYLRLSPAYDINPSIEKDELVLGIDTHDNTLSFQLAKSVGEYFQLNGEQMDRIIREVTTATQNWKQIADKIGISRAEQGLMENAFSIKG